MNVRLSPRIAAAYTVSGVCLLVGALVAGDTEILVSLAVPGAALTLVGGLAFGPLPYLWVTESRATNVLILIAVPLLLFVIPYRLYHRDRLYIDDGRLLLARAGRRIPPITIGQQRHAHPGDWARLVASKDHRR